MKTGGNQINLFDQFMHSLPAGYEPVRPDHFEIARIHLARGSVSTPERRRFVKRICELYPQVKVVECLDTPHNRIELPLKDALALHRAGKRTLVFGELKTAVRFSEETGNTCPNYWHFSPYGFCPYGCKYCYLAGTQGVKFSPTVKIYVNLQEIINEIHHFACCQDKPTAFYLGKLQDALALDPLTAYSTVLIPFFADHPYARLTLLTKSANVDRLVELEHRKHTVLSWSVNPPEVCDVFEENVPSIEERLVAMRRVVSVGYPVRAVMMPIIPVERWQEVYAAFTRHLIETVPLQRLTLGGICSYKAARGLMESKLGLRNPISVNIEDNSEPGDGRARYFHSLRSELYSHIVRVARSLQPDLELALCLEDRELLKKLSLDKTSGKCNCVL